MKTFILKLWVPSIFMATLLTFNSFSKEIYHFNINPMNDTNLVGDLHCISVTINDIFNRPVPGRKIKIHVSGANSHYAFGKTDPEGYIQFCYTGLCPGLDSIFVYDGHKLIDTVFKYWNGKLIISGSPDTATNEVGKQHCVSGKVLNSNNQPVANIWLNVKIWGANSFEGKYKTDAQGNIQFCYTGLCEGNDTIVLSSCKFGDTISKKWVGGVVADVSSPNNFVADVGKQSCMTIKIFNYNYNPVPNIPIKIKISGPNPGVYEVKTDSLGNATFCYKGYVPGEDTVDFFAGCKKIERVYQLWAGMMWVDATQSTNTNVVGQEHTVDATTWLSSGTNSPRPQALADVPVTIKVFGANHYSYASTTNSQGKITFKYTGFCPGLDTIVVCAAGQYYDTLYKTWTGSLYLDVTPGIDTNLVGQIHLINVKVVNSLQYPSVNAQVKFWVKGIHHKFSLEPTNDSGETQFEYRGLYTGLDTIIVCVAGKYYDTVYKVWKGHLILQTSPEVDTNYIGDRHCLKTRVTDQNGVPVPTVSVSYKIYGPHGKENLNDDNLVALTENIEDSNTNYSSFQYEGTDHCGTLFTDSLGWVTFCYDGYFTGKDTIVVKVAKKYVDTVYKYWIDSPSTQVCDAGRIFTFGEATSVNVCVDTIPDWIRFFNSGDCQFNFSYIITDNNGNILTVTTSDSFDFNNAGGGICRVYGICFNGSLVYQTGWTINQITADTCWDLTDNYLTIYKDTACDTGCINGMSLCLDGEDDFVKIPANATLNLKDDFTFEGWICPQDNDPWQAIFEYNDGKTIGTHFYLRNKGNRLYANLVDIVGRPHTYESKDQAWWVDSCIHVALVRCGDTVKFYVNGKYYPAVNTNGKPIGSNSLLTSGDLYFGARPSTTNIFEFEGSFNDFRMWEQCRSGNEISSDYNVALNGTENGLAGYWNFDNPDVNTAYDHSLNNNNGAIYGASKCYKCCGPQGHKPPLTPNVICLDGDTDHVFIPANPTLDVKNNFTIEAWGQPGDKLFWQSIVEYNNGNNRQGVHLYFRWRNGGTVRTIHANLIDKSGKSHWYRTPVNKLVWNPGQCHHVALTRCSDTVFIYVDGVKYNTDNYLGGPIGTKMVETSYDLFFGARIKDGDPIFELNGYIDEVRIWNVCRSEAEIQGNMNTELNGPKPNLVGLWNFNSPSSSNVYDLSGYGNNGLLVDDAKKVPGFHCPGNTEKKSFVSVNSRVLNSENNNAFNLNNFPNPFSNFTTIYYSLPKDAHVSLIIYDMNGRMVKELVNGYQVKGTYTVNWKAIDVTGNSLHEGIYLIRMITDEDFSKTRTMILQR